MGKKRDLTKKFSSKEFKEFSKLSEDIVRDMKIREVKQKSYGTMYPPQKEGDKTYLRISVSA